MNKQWNCGAADDCYTREKLHVEDNLLRFVAMLNSDHDE
jgi:hypothetical protein